MERETTEELKARAWAIANQPKKPRIGRPPNPPEHVRMSAMKFAAVVRILDWTPKRTAYELGVSEDTVEKWADADWELPVPRTVELALLFCLIRDQPTKLKENSELLARMA